MQCARAILSFVPRPALQYFSILSLKCSVGIATDYGLDGPGSNPSGDETFPPVQTGPGAYPASCKMGTGSFWGKVRPGRAADHSPPSSAADMEE